jgi:phage tail-like protein
MPPQNPALRAYGASVFALELDQIKQTVGLFKSIEGGGVKMELIKYQAGQHHPTFLRSGKPKYEDIKVQVGMAMSQTFYDWIAAFFRGDMARKTGAIIAGDFYYNERARREFDQAMISEIGFPKLDGNDKGACYMNVTITPETVVYKPGNGGKIDEGAGFDNEKLWAACNFDFTIDGFAEACKRVTKVEPFVLKQKPIEYHVGGRREPVKVPGRLEYPNLVFSLPESDAQPFIDHHDKYTIKGVVQPNARLHGEINTYDNQRGKLFTVQFAGAEIFALTHDKRDAGSEEIAQVKVEMSIEYMRFFYLRRMAVE